MEAASSRTSQKGAVDAPTKCLLLHTWTNKLLTAAINLLEARANQMVTAEEWEALAQAVKEETGQYVEWRNWDELEPE
jgi:hypothetical protein